MALRIAVAVAIATLALAPSALAQARGPVAGKHRVDGRSTSTNWSGYDVTGSGASHVIGSWTQPAATCSLGENSWSSPWVGIDGDTSNTVEQIGTDTDCVNGQPSYYAWYEMYPKGLVQISIPVSPGDKFTGEVTVGARGSYKLTLINTSANASFTTTQTNRRARNASVDWIMEGGSVLTNFGSVAFSGTNATINGQTGALDTFTAADPITMVDKKGATRAQPTALDSKGGFAVDFVHS